MAFDADKTQVLAYAYTAEKMSSHPLASAICQEAGQKNVTAFDNAHSFEAFSGKGICAFVHEKECLVGTKEFLSSFDVDKKELTRAEEKAQQEEASGNTVVFVALDKKLLGIISIKDKIREDSRGAIQRLKQMKIIPVMLTGDNVHTAKAVAQECGIEHFHASLLPADKEKIISEHAQNFTCAMVGDGINDAPALSRADIGIAIGAGTDVAIDCADIVLSKNSLVDAVSAVELSKATLKCIKQNLFWALIYNAVCIPLAAGALYPIFAIKLSPMIASAAMSFSSIFVVTNSLRLKRVKIYGFNTKKEIKEQENFKKVEENEMFGKKTVYEIEVEGMMCQKCAEHTKKAIESIKGVASAEVDENLTRVKIKASSAVSLDSIKEAVKNAG